MSRKEKWKNFGKSTGQAFKNFGKAVAKTAQIALGDEQNTVEENGQSKLRNAWATTGKGFGNAGKNLGKAAAGTIKPNDEKEEATEEEIIDVDSNLKEDTK